MKVKKLPMAVFASGRGLRLNGRISIILLLLLLLMFFALIYLKTERETQNTIKEDFISKENYLQLDDSSFFIPQNSSNEKQEELRQEVQIVQPILPVQGKIIHDFGWWQEKGKGFEEWKYMPGIDWQVAGVQEVKAILPGKVEAIEKRSDFGYTVILSHRDQLKSLYGYCSKVRVKPGEEVRQGQFVAQVQGKLHFRILKDSKPLNPKEYFIN